MREPVYHAPKTRFSLAGCLCSRVGFFWGHWRHASRAPVLRAGAGLGVGGDAGAEPLAAPRPQGCGSKIGTQTGSLVNFF